MRVVINGSFCADKRRAGVQRYAWELARRLLLEDDVFVAVPGPIDSGDVPAEKQVVRPPGMISRRFGPWAWIQRELSGALDTDVLWSPTNRAPLGVERHVLTIHDLAVLDHPEWFRRSFVNLHRIYIPRLVKKARSIITDSDFTKTRLVERLGVLPGKIVVAPPGIDSMFRPVDEDAEAAVRKHFGLPETFVLVVGTIEPRKNVPRLIEAWSTLPRKIREGAPLVVAGAEGRVFASSSRFKSSLSTGVTLTGFVQDADLPALYSAATVFAYPSLYEGFGFPPLEAMACGTSVLSSNVTATAETLEDKAVLVDPTSTDAIRDALLSLLTDSALRERLCRAGLAHARRFSWENASAGVLTALRRAAL